MIISSILKNWFSYFGFPRKSLTDNGGEFLNDKFREMNEKLKVDTINTAEIPSSNGSVERLNLSLAEAMLKTINDIKCASDVVLA